MAGQPRARKAKIDKNQPEIVENLRKAGFSVEVGYNDIIVGRENVTLWVEVKTEDCYSKKTGKLLENKKTPAQRELDQTFTGARIYAKSSDDIFGWFGVVVK